MNDVKNEKQLIPIKKIFFYTVAIGIILMIIAAIAGYITIGNEGLRFGLQEATTKN